MLKHFSHDEGEFILIKLIFGGLIAVFNFWVFRLN